MSDKRCKTIGHTNVDFGILAHRKRTGADISYWFGNYFDSG